MTPEERNALIHAELDGELSSEQRADLARLLLADPQARAFRDELGDLRSRLESLAQVEPPAGLRESVLTRLPSAPHPVGATYRTAAFGRWRLAALLAGLLTAGTIVYETVQGPAPTSRETAGTMAADTAMTLDSVAVGGGLVTGHAMLYRDKNGLAVGLEVSAPQAVDVLITTGASSFRINGLLSQESGGSTRRMVALPGVSTQGQQIDLSFLIDERIVGRATLRAPAGS